MPSVPTRNGWDIKKVQRFTVLRGNFFCEVCSLQFLRFGHIAEYFHFTKCSLLKDARQEIAKIVTAKCLILNEIAKFPSTKISLHMVG